MPFGRVAVPVAVKDTSKWASLDALADELTSATKTAVSPISGFDKEPYVLFSEIGDFGIKGKIIFIVSDNSSHLRNRRLHSCHRPHHRLKDHKGNRHLCGGFASWYHGSYRCLND